jgi:hypothetical protein
VVAVALAAAALPLASYGLVYAKAGRVGPTIWANLRPGLGGLFAHVTAEQYRYLLGHFGPSDVQRTLLRSYVYAFLFAGLGLLLLAALRARRTPERFALGTLAAVAGFQVAGAFSYGAIDPTSYFLAPMALAVCGVVPWAARLAAKGRRAAGPVGLAFLAAAVALNVPWVRTAASRRAGYERFDAVLRSMWASIPLERGIVLWGDDLFARLLAYQIFERSKPGLEVLNPWRLFYPPERARFVARHGFDPVQGIGIPASWLRNPPPGRPVELILADIVRRITALADVPVVLFDGEGRSVRLMKKPPPAPGSPDDAR